jgi:HK97 gp10 family phage protein
MPVNVTFKLHGLAEIETALKVLGVQASNRIARSALNRAAGAVMKRARELAPQRGAPDDPYATGELKRSVTKRLGRQRRGSDTQTAVVGVERPRSRIVHLLEFGTAHMPAEPFLRPALDERSQEAIQVMTQAMKDGIEREINKLKVKPRT